MKGSWLVLVTLWGESIAKPLVSPLMPVAHTCYYTTELNNAAC